MPRMAMRLAVLAAGMFVFAGAVDSASAQIGPSGEIEEFDYTLSSAPPHGFAGVIYNSGVAESSGGTLDFQSGAVQEANFLDNAWTLIPTGTQTLNVKITDWRIVTAATITVTAHVPPGASMTVIPGDTGTPFRLNNGKFSIPTGVDEGAKPPKRGTQVVKCRGSARSCQAKINLAGGAHNRKIVIQLTDTDFSLRSIKAPPRRKHAAYSLTNGHFIQGGSKYVVTLNAARSSRPGSQLTLRFA